MLYSVIFWLFCSLYSSHFSPTLLLNLSVGFCALMCAFNSEFVCGYFYKNPFFILSCSCFTTSILYLFEQFNIIIFKLFSNSSISSLLRTKSSHFCNFWLPYISLCFCVIFHSDLIWGRGEGGMFSIGFLWSLGCWNVLKAQFPISSSEKASGMWLNFECQIFSFRSLHIHR